MCFEQCALSVHALCLFIEKAHCSCAEFFNKRNALFLGPCRKVFGISPATVPDTHVQQTATYRVYKDVFYLLYFYLFHCFYAPLTRRDFICSVRNVPELTYILYVIIIIKRF